VCCERPTEMGPMTSFRISSVEPPVSVTRDLMYLSVN
jgi:hypothetical protein